MIVRPLISPTGDRLTVGTRGHNVGVSDGWSISDGYFDIDGGWHQTAESTRNALREAMGTPVEGPPLWFVAQGEKQALWNSCWIHLDDGRIIGPQSELADDLPIGYHDLVPVEGGPTTRLIIHPISCPPIPSEWGLAAQIYALWSDHSWGIGDLGDLRRLAESLDLAGGRVILVSPLHQPAPSWPQGDSPYYPSSRRAWNPLLLDMDLPTPPDLVCTPDSLIDRDAVWAAKRAVLDALHRQSEGRQSEDRQTQDRQTQDRQTQDCQTQERQSERRSPQPDSIALWNALCDEYGAEWRNWPEEWRRFDLDALTARLEHDPGFAARADFHQWCQSRVGQQLDRIAKTGVDIIGDLAVGFSPGGADAWEYQDLLALDARIGAPPDPFSASGQDWGIPPFIPWRVRNALYQPFIDTIRAALRGVQGLRMDHVMGLFRQFWVPAGCQAAEGAYVTFPAHELMSIICIEATRAGAYVVGEDLGTVEPSVRKRLAERNIAGTRVLWFEDDPPSQWPVHCMATVTTHDLPTVAGVLSGTDGGTEQQLRLAEVAPGNVAAAVIAEVHAALLAAPPKVRLLSMDDLSASTERPNHPGTVDVPNWRRRLPLRVDAIVLPHHHSRRSDTQDEP